MAEEEKDQNQEQQTEGKEGEAAPERLEYNQSDNTAEQYDQVGDDAVDETDRDPEDAIVDREETIVDAGSDAESGGDAETDDGAAGNYSSGGEQTTEGEQTAGDDDSTDNG